MDSDLVSRLRERGVQPTAQRVAVAEYVLTTDEHPSAEHVYARVRARFPLLSRATVYNTLNLFVEKRLLRQLTLAEGRVVFDPNLERHHHFIDETTGAIHDVPWPALSVTQLDELPDFDVREYQVVMRGQRRTRQKARK